MGWILWRILRISLWLQILGQSFKQMPNANSDLEKKNHCHQYFKLQNQKLPTEVIVFKIQNSESQIFFCILIFFCFYVQRATTVLCFKKKFQVFFSTCFFQKKLFQVFFST